MPPKPMPATLPGSAANIPDSKSAKKKKRKSKDINGSSSIPSGPSTPVQHTQPKSVRPRSDSPEGSQSNDGDRRARKISRIDSSQPSQHGKSRSHSKGTPHLRRSSSLARHIPRSASFRRDWDEMGVSSRDDFPSFDSEPTIVSVQGPSGTSFERLFDKSFPSDLDQLQVVSRRKFKLKENEPVTVVYRNSAGADCGLEDDDDFKAFQANAQRSSQIQVTVKAEAPFVFVVPAPPTSTTPARPPPTMQKPLKESNVASTSLVIAPQTAQSTPSKSPKEKGVVQQNRQAAAPADKPKEMGAASSKAPIPPEATAATPASAVKKKKVKQKAKEPIQSEKQLVPQESNTADQASSQTPQMSSQIPLPDATVDKVASTSLAGIDGDAAATVSTSQQSHPLSSQPTETPQKVEEYFFELPTVRAARLRMMSASQESPSGSPAATQATLLAPNSSPSKELETPAAIPAPKGRKRKAAESLEPEAGSQKSAPAASVGEEPASQPTAESPAKKPTTARCRKAVEEAESVALTQSAKAVESASVVDTLPAKEQSQQQPQVPKSQPEPEVAAPAQKKPLRRNTRSAAKVPVTEEPVPEPVAPTPKSGDARASATELTPELSAEHLEATPAKQPSKPAAKTPARSTRTPRRSVEEIDPNICRFCEKAPLHDEEQCEVFVEGVDRVMKRIAEIRQKTRQSEHDKETKKVLMRWLGTQFATSGSDPAKADGATASTSTLLDNSAQATNGADGGAPKKTELGSPSKDAKDAGHDVDRTSRSSEDSEVNKAEQEEQKQADELKAKLVQKKQKGRRSSQGNEVEEAGAARMRADAAVARAETRQAAAAKKVAPPETPKIPIMEISPTTPQAVGAGKNDAKQLKLPSKSKAKTSAAAAATSTSPPSEDEMNVDELEKSQEPASSLRAPSESSEIELATSPMLQAVSQSEHSQDIDDIVESSLPPAKQVNPAKESLSASFQLAQRARKLRQTEKTPNSQKSTTDELLPPNQQQCRSPTAGRKVRSASATSSDTSEDSDSDEDDSNSDSDDDIDQEAAEVTSPLPENHDEDEIDSDFHSVDEDLGSKKARGGSPGKAGANDKKAPASTSSLASASSASSSSFSSSDSGSDSDSSTDSESEASAKPNGTKRKSTPAETPAKATNTLSSLNPFSKGKSASLNRQAGRMQLKGNVSPFTKLTDLRPSDLRKSLSQPSSPMGTGGSTPPDGILGSNGLFRGRTHSNTPDPEAVRKSATSSKQPSPETESESGSDSSDSDSSDEASKPKSSVPAAKRAGATIAPPRKKRSVFSVFS